MTRFVCTKNHISSHPIAQKNHISSHPIAHKNHISSHPIAHKNHISSHSIAHKNHISSHSIAHKKSYFIPPFCTKNQISSHPIAHADSSVDPFLFESYTVLLEAPRGLKKGPWHQSHPFTESLDSLVPCHSWIQSFRGVRSTA